MFALGIAVDLIPRFCAAHGTGEIIQRRIKGEIPLAAELLLLRNDLTGQAARERHQRQRLAPLVLGGVKAAALALLAVGGHASTAALEAILARKVLSSWPHVEPPSFGPSGSGIQCVTVRPVASYQSL